LSLTKPKYYLYAYGHPDTGEIFYIGKGSKRRFIVHLNYVIKNSLAGKNPHLFRKIKQILSTNKLPLTHCFSYTDNEELAYINEQKIIARIGLANLCNLDYGGKKNLIITNEQRIKMSNAREGIPPWNKGISVGNGKNNSFYGRKHSKESIALMKKSQAKYKERKSQVSKNRVVSDLTKKRMSESAKKRAPSFLGKHHTEETKRKISEQKTGVKQSRDAVNKRVVSFKNMVNNTNFSERMSIAAKIGWETRRGIMSSH
jgi:hypothetical protein